MSELQTGRLDQNVAEVLVPGVLAWGAVYARRFLCEKRPA